MEKIAVVGFGTGIVEKELRKSGFVINRFEPDVVVSFGGDGSALMAEQLYPSVPRLAIKHSKVCERCASGKTHDFSKIFHKLKNKKYKIVKEMKVEGVVNGDKDKQLVGLNEINIAHAVPTKAIRFDVALNGRLVAADLIGDGVIVATPYGSSGYFRTITDRRFSKGIGVAFNNVNKKIKYRFASENAKVKIKLNRGPALMCADNNTTMIPLRNGDVITVKKSTEKAKIIELTGEKRKIEL